MKYHILMNHFQGHSAISSALDGNIGENDIGGRKNIE